jgi:hypothetical protein
MAKYRRWMEHGSKVKSYYISAKGDTTANHVTQYKVYYADISYWEAGFVDSASKKNKGYLDMVILPEWFKSC